MSSLVNLIVELMKRWSMLVFDSLLFFIVDVHAMTDCVFGPFGALNRDRITRG